jgi:hypothetical protein
MRMVICVFGASDFPTFIFGRTAIVRSESYPRRYGRNISNYIKPEDFSLVLNVVDRVHAILNTLRLETVISPTKAWDEFYDTLRCVIRFRIIDIPIVRTIHNSRRGLRQNARVQPGCHRADYQTFCRPV